MINVRFDEVEDGLIVVGDGGDAGSVVLSCDLGGAGGLTLVDGRAGESDAKVSAGDTVAEGCLEGDGDVAEAGWNGVSSRVMRVCRHSTRRWSRCHRG